MFVLCCEISKFPNTCRFWLGSCRPCTARRPQGAGRSKTTCFEPKTRHVFGNSRISVSGAGRSNSYPKLAISGKHRTFCVFCPRSFLPEPAHQKRQTSRNPAERPSNKSYGNKQRGLFWKRPRSGLARHSRSEDETRPQRCCRIMGRRCTRPQVRTPGAGLPSTTICIRLCVVTWRAILCVCSGGFPRSGAT